MAAVSMSEPPVRKPLGIREFHRLILGHGGAAARRLYGFFWGSITVVMAVLVLMFAAAVADLMPFEVLFSWGLAMMTAGAYVLIVTPPLFDVGVYEELLRTNRFPGEEGNIREWLRFLGAVGVRGQVPGCVAWAVASWAVWYGMMVVAVAFAYLLLPTLGPWTPYVFAGLDAAVTVAWFVSWYRWQRRMSKRAEARGFHIVAAQRKGKWVG